MQTPQANSVRHLQGLYGVVVAIALTIAVENLVTDSSRRTVAALLTSALLVTLVPFYHGALRHLDCVYVETTSVSTRPGALLVDFFALFVESCLFIGLAASIAHAHAFAWAYTVLLLVDIAWAVVTQLALPTGHASWAALRWLEVNVATLTLVGLVLAADIGLSLSGGAIAGAILAIALTRTIVDYARSWRFYAAATEGEST